MSQRVLLPRAGQRAYSCFFFFYIASLFNAGYVGKHSLGLVRARVCHVCFFHIFPRARRGISLTPSSIYSRGRKDSGICGVSSARCVLEELPVINASPIHGAVPRSSLKCGPPCWSSVLVGMCLSPCFSHLPLPLCRWVGWGPASRRSLLRLCCPKQGCCCEDPLGVPVKAFLNYPRCLQAAGLITGRCRGQTERVM